MATNTTTTVTQPSPILEGSLSSFVDWLTKLQGGALPASRMQDFTDPTTGETRKVFKGIDTSAYAPKVAGQTDLQKDAATAAEGLGSLVGPGAELAGGVVPGSIEAYMSPYQQQVINAQMEEFDRQAAINRQGIRDQAIQMGAFGGGREGVQLAEYAKGSDMNRSLLQGQLLQQGFMDAAQRRAADLQAQQGLGTYQQAMGQAQQGYEQAKLDATQIAGREEQFAPFTQLGLVGQQLAQIQPGAFPTQTVGYAPPAAPASPMSQFLTGATGAAGIMGKLGLFG